ncbi:hypothetical protein [Desulfopila aestuarii]|uniref:hypothetical protein n=1 Tax=Desulfopila aestuarii TaxID=231440 RepID=UPI0013564F30|nr:hypothetical protein [Desulfopila aestuarii]
MSPTSYQTAPPRVEVAYYTPFARGVKRYLDFPFGLFPECFEVTWKRLEMPI